MKKIVLYTFLLLFTTISLYAGTLPAQGFNYQAVARSASGSVLANQSVGVKLSIMDAASSGTTLYSETFTVTTNAFGLFTVAVGSGTPVTGTFVGVDWSSDQRFLNVQIDPAGGSSYTDMGTTQLLTVPYAKRADNMTIYQTGTTNPDKILIQHSPAYPSWGLKYSDAADDMIFQAGGTPIMDVALGYERVGIMTATPATELDVNGTSRATVGSDYVQMTGTKVQSSRTDTASLVPIAYGYVDGTVATPTVSADTRNFTVTKTSTGSYSIHINNQSYYFSNYVPQLSLVDAGFITASSAGGNFLVYTKNTSGTATDARFYFVVYKP